jgi:hypothetical protein
MLDNTLALTSQIIFPGVVMLQGQGTSLAIVSQNVQHQGGDDFIRKAGDLMKWCTVPN